jgi:glycosyltransferase involved in cell wall biosynthesis
VQTGHCPFQQIEEVLVAHLAHIFPTFAVGGAQVIACELINALGADFRHTVVSLDGRFNAREKLDTPSAVNFLDRSGRSGWRDARKCLTHLSPDLLLTCNWGSFDWVAAAASIPGLRHIHQEHGFGLDEAFTRSGRRNLARRLVLPRCRRLVVPSRTLAAIAQNEWRLGETLVCHIANGIDQAKVRRMAGAESRRNDRHLVVGTVAPLRPEKRIDSMIEAFARLVASTIRDRRAIELVIVGDGVERPRLEEMVSTLGLDDQVRFAGYRDNPAAMIADFDLYAISSATEQMPVSVLQAMALAKPVVGFDVGDIRFMVAEENRRFIIEPGNVGALADAMVGLIADEGTRSLIGNANAARQHHAFDHAGMIERYGELIDRNLRT